MTPTQVLQEIRKMRFEEAYEGWSEGRLTQGQVIYLYGNNRHAFKNTGSVTATIVEVFIKDQK